nr:Chain B, Solute carrier family 15 member 2 [Homo sapiens]
IKLETKKTKL